MKGSQVTRSERIKSEPCLSFRRPLWCLDNIVYCKYNITSGTLNYATTGPVQQYRSTAEKTQGDLNSPLLAPIIERSTASRNKMYLVSDYLPSPGGRLSKILARRVRGRRPFFHRGARSAVWWGVARSRCLRGSAGARERPVFKTYTSKSN